MSKQTVSKTRIFEANGVMVNAKQNQKKTKNVGEPHTLVTIAIPLMDNRKFEEMCLNNGARICYRIEYIPNPLFDTQKTKESKGILK